MGTATKTKKPTRKEYEEKIEGLEGEIEQLQELQRMDSIVISNLKKENNTLTKTKPQSRLVKLEGLRKELHELTEQRANDKDEIVKLLQEHGKLVSASGGVDLMSDKDKEKDKKILEAKWAIEKRLNDDYYPERMIKLRQQIEKAKKEL